MSKVHTTSLAVNGLPSCQLTPSSSGKVSSVPSSFHDRPVARSGTTDCRLFCGTCWSNMTRLLNTPIIGPSAKTVASSWIDTLAGLSGLYIFRIPPCFWANAASAANIATSNEPAAASLLSLRFIFVYLPWLSRVRPALFGLLVGILDDTHGRTLLSQAHCRALVSKSRRFGIYHGSIGRGRMADRELWRQK